MTLDQWIELRKALRAITDQLDQPVSTEPVLDVVEEMCRTEYHKGQDDALALTLMHLKAIKKGDENINDT